MPAPIRKAPLLFPLAVFLTLIGASAAVSLPDPAAIQQAVQRANDHFIAASSPSTNGWMPSVYETGNMRAYQVLGLDRYLQRAIDWGTLNKWKTGEKGPTNADSQVCGQTYVDLYRIDPQPIRLAAIQAAIDERVANPVAVMDWWWIDAFYMAGPVYARFGNLYSNHAYFDKLWLMYSDTKTRRGLYDPAYGLWYRDETTKKATTKNGQKQFWARGNGWVLAAMARIVEEMPPTAPHRDDFIAMLQTMAAALKPLQGADGMWRASLLDPAEVPNPETSGTALFTFALAWGIRHGYLSPLDYQDAVARAWNGMVAIALHPDGTVGYVQAKGSTPAATTYNTTYDFGVGAFLLAGSEVLLLAGGAPAAPVITSQPTNRNVNAGATVSFSVSAVGQPPLRCQWWCNGTNLADGTLTRGATAATLTLSNVQPTQAGTYWVVVSNASGTATSSNAVLAVFPVFTLAAALDAANLAWTTGGTAPWMVQTNVTRDFAAAGSGAIGKGKTTWLQTTVTGPGTVGFWWKVSSAPSKNYLTFYVNGSTKARLSGEVDWQWRTLALPKGKQVLKWAYSKSSSTVMGQDRGWVDQVQFQPTTVAGSVPSTVVAQALTAIVTVSGGTVHLRWEPAPDQACQVLYKDSLGESEWKLLGVFPPGTVAAVDDSAAGRPQRFYRVLGY